MTKLLLPLPDVKRYAKALKKSPQNTINHTQLMDIVVKALGHENLRAYKLHSKSKRNFEAAYQAVDRLSLYELNQWNDAFNQEVARHVPDPDCGYSIFEKYFQYQLDHLAELPALRISGLLYLLSHFSKKPFFEPDTMVFDGPGLLSYLRTETLAQGIKLRLAEYGEKNRLTQSRYHEGVFSNLLGMWSQGSLSGNRFIEEVETLLDEEKRYLSDCVADSPPPWNEVRFYFPAVQRDEDQPSNTGFLQKVRNAVNVNSPLLLGYEKVTVTGMALFDSKKSPENLLLSNAQIKENILISGVPGAGRVRIGLGIIHQAIMAGSGSIFIDSSGSGNVVRTAIASMARSVGRKDDVVFYGIHHKSIFNAVEIRRMIVANKTIVISLPSAEKDPDALMPVFVKLIHTLESAIMGIGKQQMSQYSPYLITLCDTLRLWRTSEAGALSSLVKQANKANIGVLSIDGGLEVAQKVIDIGYFQHWLLMRQEDLIEPLEPLSNIGTRRLVRLSQGEFLYVDAGKPMDEVKTTYIGPYSDAGFDSLYLVMS